MTNSKHIAGLDEVLADYAQAAPEFDAQVLHAFMQKYPEHARALQRYAHVQLTSIPASAHEVEQERVSDEEMLPAQSKLLQRLQQLRGDPPAADVDAAISKLGEIADSEATDAAAVAIFGGCDFGEDVLFLTLTESEEPVEFTPDWFYEELGTYVNMPMLVVQAAVAKRGHLVRQQRHSSRNKPVHSPPITWTQAVEQSITDEARRRAILERQHSA